MWKRVIVRSTSFLCPKDVYRVNGNIPHRLKTLEPPLPKKLISIDLLGVTLCLATQL